MIWPLIYTEVTYKFTNRVRVTVAIDKYRLMNTVFHLKWALNKNFNIEIT